MVNELKRNALQIDLSWLAVVHVDELNELLATLK
jgi:hypothetical protein